MFEVFFRVWYLIAILPVLIVLEGYDMWKEFMKKGGHYSKLPYYLLIILTVLLVILLIAGYR